VGKKFTLTRTIYVHDNSSKSLF